MNQLIESNGKPAFRVAGRIMRETDKAFLLLVDGDENWFPKNTIEIKNVKEHPNRTNGHKTTHFIHIQEWIYKEKFPQG